MTDSSATYDVHYDHLGTPQFLTDAEQNIVWQQSMSAFGESTITGDIEFNFRFPGQYYDGESGLYYNFHRYYSPELGRYVHTDPIGLAGGLNTFIYMRSNAMIGIDPLGLDGVYIHFDGYPIDTGLGFNASLGHAGIVAIDPVTGTTRYYEYGRYGNDFGRVRRRIIPDVEIDEDGLVKQESLSKLYAFLSKKIGKGRPISEKYDSEADFQKIIDFAEKRKNNKDHDPYSWNPFSPNHCKTFANDALNAGR